ncbi:hypothetical protein GC173_01600 [bacterium]|nr:hypothetical protein [bacterium]
MMQPKSPVSYPILLTGHDRRALVVGGGRVARRKITALLEGGISVTVLAPAPLDLAGFPDGEFTQIEGVWPQDTPELSKFHLIFATTNNRAINADVARTARLAGIPVNVADAPDECDFFTVGSIRHDGMIISISSAGRSPADARRLREELQDWLNKRMSSQ